MAVAELTGDGRIAVYTQFSDKELIKSVPGAKWDPGSKFWHVRQSWTACLALRGVFRDRLEVGPLLTQWSWDEYNTRVKPAIELRTAITLPDDAPDHVKAVLESWR